MAILGLVSQKRQSMTILALVSQQRDKKKGKVFGSAGDDEFSGIKILEIKLYDSSFKFQY